MKNGIQKTGIKRTVSEGTFTFRQDGVTETGFNLNLKHPKEKEKQKKYMKEKKRFSRHWIPGNEGQSSQRDGKQTR